MTRVADRLAEIITPLVGELPVRLRAWDGSEAGPLEAPLVELRSPEALRRLIWHPGELGAAQAYVTGEADLPGTTAELDATLALVMEAARKAAPTRAEQARAVVRAGRAALELGLVGRPPAPPATQAQVRGRLHSLARDRAAISHHYDVPAEFYELILDESMAYSCGYHATPETPVADAQRAKLDLVCTKLGLGPDSTLLDIGCGWGSLTVHAAQHFGARVLGVTIAAEQQRYVAERIARAGLADRAEARLCDYRDVEGTFDAVSSIEMGEHVGQENYPTFARVLQDRVRPGGRVLVQQMSRTERPGGGAFIESFIAPDMHMRPVGQTVDLLERAGLEVRDVHALREHYVLTVAGWIERFEAHEDRLRELVGEEMLRVWRLYLVGGSAAFRDGRMGVDQILAVRPGGSHDLPWVRA
ncbi:SAM-dependent methyltransferase [Nocardioides sp. Kera G14]|uniref:SAM-dependent methyltransferase n=1 Tax=Nocardioides sp. Kera G14 TaxID=2884264 RepID=UPI001D11B7BB|nr:cyclopropane-fatty-acyl-phospholipid synthase family protein [Nocardioides sp. Kera G14]UDY24031.1 cyclopropane-fatty-acyl-phospholipid synthase family protein [Nocardioides sp. Kera G14]